MRREALRRFGESELRAVGQARAEAERLVSDFYVLAPREWARMSYEVRTLDELSPEEICGHAFAQVLCYQCTRRVGATVIDRRDLYRVCLQDHRILRAAGELALDPLLLFVLTHELIHVVRFGQRMQQPDLGPELRLQEELSVEQTTRQILAPVADRALRRVLDACSQG